MATEIALFADSSMTIPFDVVSLGQTHITGGVTYGDAVAIYGRNTGTTRLANVSVTTDGFGGSRVQLAEDVGGTQGPWMPPGQPVAMDAIREIAPGDSFKFWARSMYLFSDIEGTYDFEFVVRGLSVGE